LTALCPPPQTSKVILILLALSVLNWLPFFAFSMYIHSDAIGTLPSQRGFVVKSHGNYTPVSELVWVFSLFYSSLTPAVWITYGVASSNKKSLQTPRFMRLAMFAFLLLWCIGWYWSIGNSFKRSLEDWQILKPASKQL
jgi:hypothetical protein